MKVPHAILYMYIDQNIKLQPYRFKYQSNLSGSK